MLIGQATGCSQGSSSGLAETATDFAGPQDRKGITVYVWASASDTTHFGGIRTELLRVPGDCYRSGLDGNTRG